MKSLSKIDRPPAAENWSRMQYANVQRTARSLFAFLRGGVAWNYAPTRLVSKFYIEDGITREVGLRIVSKSGSPLGRQYNLEAVRAFFDLVEAHPIEGLRAFAELIEWFPIGPKAAVPIKPLSVTREGGFFVPNFLNPWSDMAFDDYQASLYMSVLERSVFRLTDFEDSPGRIIFLPKQEIREGVWERRPVVWTRGQFSLLNDRELNDQIRIFAESKELARVWYADYLSKRKPH